MGSWTQYLIAYFATGIVFLAIDAVWLGVVARTLYRRLLGDLMLEKFRVGPAAAFYLLYIVGIVVFAVAPALDAERWTTALAYGAAFGFFAYATYDLTNLATLRNWPGSLSLIDLAWGTVVTGVAATLGYLIAHWLGAPG